MAISKPSWLRDWLSALNWDILTWKVYVGDAVEEGLDWAIDWINWAIGLGEAAWDKAVVAWDKAVEVFMELTATINWEVSRLWNNIDTWWHDLGDWWQTAVLQVKDWIGVAEDFLEGLIDNVERGLASLSATWEDFWTTTWPQLLTDFNSLLVNVSNFFTVTLPTLASKLDIGKAFDDFRLEWKGLFSFWENFKVEIPAFFTDPIDWLWSKLVDYLEKNW